jgi:hypothetical protein
MILIGQDFFIYTKVFLPKSGTVTTLATVLTNQSGVA